MNCVGTELEIEDCSHGGWENHNCDHFEDAGVQCFLHGNFNNYSTSIPYRFIIFQEIICELSKVHSLIVTVNKIYSVDFFNKITIETTVMKKSVLIRKLISCREPWYQFFLISPYIYGYFNQLDFVTFITLWHPILFATKNHTYVSSIIYDAIYRLLSKEQFPPW